MLKEPSQLRKPPRRSKKSYRYSFRSAEAKVDAPAAETKAKSNAPEASEDSTEGWKLKRISWKHSQTISTGWTFVHPFFFYTLFNLNPSNK